MPDMLMTFFVTAALALLWPTVAGHTGPWWLGFWGAIAGAFWAKGAAALLPLAVVVAWGLVFRRPGWWRALRLPAGLALFAALIAPWWIGKLMTQTAGMRDTVVSDNLLWYLPQSLAVLAGPPQHLVGILFPWVFVLPPAIWQAVTAVRRHTQEREALGFVIAWAATLLACVGIAEQQRLRYYLPLVPPAALLIGWWAARIAGGERAERRMPWRVYAGIAAVLSLTTAVAALARPTWSEARHVAFPTSAVEAAVMAAGLVVMLAALVYGASRRRLRTSGATPPTTTRACAWRSRGSCPRRRSWRPGASTTCQCPSISDARCCRSGHSATSTASWRSIRAAAPCSATRPSARWGIADICASCRSTGSTSTPSSS
jgi:4-amino-4-deoxy-L-arabinose transferase-like glycosyltransferase